MQVFFSCRNLLTNGWEQGSRCYSNSSLALKQVEQVIPGNMLHHRGLLLYEDIHIIETVRRRITIWISIQVLRGVSEIVMRSEGVCKLEEARYSWNVVWRSWQSIRYTWQVVVGLLAQTITPNRGSYNIIQLQNAIHTYIETSLLAKCNQLH